MERFLTGWLLNAAALAAAAGLLGTHMAIGDGSDTTSRRLITLALVALVFTAVTQWVAPVIKVLSLPFIILSLGLALLVINALLLLFVEWITGKIDVAFQLDGFWWAMLASVVISIVGTVLAALTPIKKQ